jgi:hypothetical protein
MLDSVQTRHLSKGKALLYSLIFPGVGHFYAGRKMEGVLMMILILIPSWLVRMIGFQFQTTIAGVFLFSVFWLIIGYRAYYVTDTEKEVPDHFLNRWFVYVGAALILFVFYGTGIVRGPWFDTIGRVVFRNMISESNSPAVIPGETIAVEKTQDIKLGNIICFQSPKDQPKTDWISRCVAVPDDSLEIRDGIVFTNGQREPKERELQFRYLLVAPDEIQDALFEDWGIREYDRMPGGYSIFATEKTATFLLKEFGKQIDKITETNPNPETFPQDTSIHWNVDFLGPVWVPSKGATIELTARNTVLYASCLELENNQIRIQGTDAILNDQKLTTYTFTQNYFFVMGDNRHNALDSRFWGFVPQSQIVGKALYILNSPDTDRIGQEFK